MLLNGEQPDTSFMKWKKITYNKCVKKYASGLLGMFLGIIKRIKENLL